MLKQFYLVKQNQLTAAICSQEIIKMHLNRVIPIKQESRVNEIHAQRLHFHKDYIPSSAMQNRKQKQFLTQFPQGQEYFLPSRKKQFINLHQRSEIQERNLFDQGDWLPLIHDNMSTKDIQGAATNTLISQAMKNKLNNQKFNQRVKLKRNGFNLKKFDPKSYQSQKYLKQAQADNQMLDAYNSLDRAKRERRFGLPEIDISKQDFNKKFKQRKQRSVPIVNYHSKIGNFHMKNRLNSEESRPFKQDNHDIIDKFSYQQISKEQQNKQSMQGVSNRTNKLSLNNNLHHQIIQARVFSQKNMLKEHMQMQNEYPRDYQKRRSNTIQSRNEYISQRNNDEQSKQKFAYANHKSTRIEIPNKNNQINKIDHHQINKIQRHQMNRVEHPETNKIDQLGHFYTKGRISYAKKHLHKKLWQPNTNFNSKVRVWNPTFIPQSYSLLNQTDQYSQNGIIANPY